MFTVTSGYSLLKPSTKRPSSSPEDQTSNVPLRAVSVCETDADVGALEPEGVLAGALCPQAASDSVSANASTAEISFFITLTFLVFCSNLSPSIRPSPDVLRSPGNRFH